MDTVTLKVLGAGLRDEVAYVSGCHNRTIGFREGKDDQNHYMDSVAMKALGAGLQDEVAYVSQTWESSLMLFRLRYTRVFYPSPFRL